MERDEIVNVQAIIEEQYERELIDNYTKKTDFMNELICLTLLQKTIFLNNTFIVQV